MDPQQFLSLQYQSLREEIRETKARIFQIAAIGLFVLPGGEYLVKTLEVTLVRFILPLLVLCVGLLYLSEHRALMRCGRFIRLEIEPHVPGGITGWETWLERRSEARVASDQPRAVSDYLAWCYMLLLSAYYVTSVTMAGIAARALWPELLLATVAPLVAYGVLGVWFGRILFTSARSTRTLDETT